MVTINHLQGSEKMGKHYASKVSTYEDKVKIVSPLESAITNMEELDRTYLSTVEISKLQTLIKKADELNTIIVYRMNKDIENQENKGEKKQKLKEVNKKLKTLTPEQMDKLLSTL